MSEMHALDKRVIRLEEWKDQMQTIDLPSMRETIKKEIPEHYTRKIEQSETNTMLRIEQLIDKRLSARFGWVSRSLETIATAVIVAAILYGLKLS
jgi:hypothetical protein